MKYLARHNAARDANEPEIVAELRKLGLSVDLLNGRGIPDLMWGWRGTMGLLEVKLPLGPRGGQYARTLNPKQREWWDNWQGPRPAIVRAPEEAIDIVTRAVERGLYEPDAWRIISRASQCGIATEELTPLQVLHEWAEQSHRWRRELVEGRQRGEELEAENRKLRERLQKVGG